MLPRFSSVCHLHKEWSRLKTIEVSVLTCQDIDLGNAMGVPERHANLRRRGDFLRKLANLVNKLFRGGLEPCRRIARVWYGAGRYALSVAVEAAHVDKEVVDMVQGVVAKLS